MVHIPEVCLKVNSLTRTLIICFTCTTQPNLNLHFKQTVLHGALKDYIPWFVSGTSVFSFETSSQSSKEPFKVSLWRFHKELLLFKIECLEICACVVPCMSKPLWWTVLKSSKEKLVRNKINKFTKLCNCQTNTKESLRNPCHYIG